MGDNVFAVRHAATLVLPERPAGAGGQRRNDGNVGMLPVLQCDGPVWRSHHWAAVRDGQIDHVHHPTERFEPTGVAGEDGHAERSPAELDDRSNGREKGNGRAAEAKHLEPHPTQQRAGKGGNSRSLQSFPE